MLHCRGTTVSARGMFNGRYDSDPDDDYPDRSIASPARSPTDTEIFGDSDGGAEDEALLDEKKEILSDMKYTRSDLKASFHLEIIEYMGEPVERLHEIHEKMEKREHK